MKAYEKGRIPQIIFGSHRANELSKYLLSLEIDNCLIVSDPQMIEHSITVDVLKDLTLHHIKYDIYKEVISEPTDIMCNEIAQMIKENHYECVIGIGGGSPMDAAKAGALIAGIPEDITDLHQYGKSGSLMKSTWTPPCKIILMPTTSGTGAETTASAVVSSTKHNLKFSFGNSNLTASLCIIDPMYTMAMPAIPTINGGLDAMCHTIEILVGTKSNDYTNVILYECLKKVWKWLPVAINEPMNQEAREQLSWASHNSLANGGMPNGHAVAHAIGSLYHIVHGQACIMVLPTVIRHFAVESQLEIANIARIIGVKVTGDAIIDGNNVADRILEFYKDLGVKPFYETMISKNINDSLDVFCEKMIPAILDDFKSQQWLPPIHTGDYQKKITKICTMIYEER